MRELQGRPEAGAEAQAEESGVKATAFTTTQLHANLQARSQECYVLASECAQLRQQVSVCELRMQEVKHRRLAYSPLVYLRAVHKQVVGGILRRVFLLLFGFFVGALGPEGTASWFFLSAEWMVLFAWMDGVCYLNLFAE